LQRSRPTSAPWSRPQLPGVDRGAPEAALTEVSHIGREARPDLLIPDYHLADGQIEITAICKTSRSLRGDPGLCDERRYSAGALGARRRRAATLEGMYPLRDIGRAAPNLVGRWQGTERVRQIPNQ
jgi:hypothetical protein